MAGNGPTGTFLAWFLHTGEHGQCLAEIEAKEACDWLRAAGFPQYAQLYEDSLFPIEIASVTRDHDFLDRDAIEALCRRLNTLNKCAVMKLEISPQRKRSEDSDEDEPCAISGKWTFQRDSKRWSRLEELDVFPLTDNPGSFPLEELLLKVGMSSESVLTDLSEQPEVGSLHSVGSSTGSQGAGLQSTCMGATRTRSVTSLCSSGNSVDNEDSFSEDIPSPKENSGFQYDTKPGGKSTRSKAKSFLKRMESLRLKSSPTKKKKVTSKLVISGPVLREGIDEEKLRSLNCVEISRLNGHHSSLPRNRSISYSTQMSSSSSSQSEAGSSAVSTPSPVTRARSHSTAYNNNKRGGMYLEGFDPFSQKQLQHHEQLLPASCDVAEQNLRNQAAVKEDVIFFIPEDHKPGTFPKALCNSSPHSRLRRESSDDSSKGSICSGQNRRNSATSLDNRLSIYDNVPCSLLLDGEEEKAPYPKLDDILHHVRGLQRFVNEWSEQACDEGDSDSALDSVSPCPSSPLQNHLQEVENGSDLDSTGNSLNEQEALSSRQRRDSGVGASLTRSSRAVPKFMKRIKAPDYKDRNVFGVPLQVNVQRTGQPLPQCIQQAMRYLRSQCLDQVGLFRKSGVKSRIQALRQMNESCTNSVSYEGQSAFDVADMVKQYFRDLPEPLLTSKLSETFLQIYQYVPKDQRLQAIKAAFMLLPDENREVLQTLLYFLNDVTAAVKENQMTNNNLAVCLAPSLFHLNSLKRETSSPRVMQRKHSLGKPDQKDLNENLAATHGLAHMIAECKKLFQIPEEMSTCRNSYVDQGLQPPKLEELVGNNNKEQSSGYKAYLQECIDGLLKEAKEKFKGWDSCSTSEQAELSYKKVCDGSPLRLWKATVEVPAAPEDVLNRVLREQYRWDDDLLDSKVIESLDNQTEIYQYILTSMAPHPTRDHVVLRTWTTDLPKRACALVATSVDHDAAPLMGVRVNVLTCRYLIEPCGSAKSKLSYISRIDCRCVIHAPPPGT
ncbi:UNVERIFIED_CONTAM: hypothetical protein FKN15_026894 [Acipenser sinensis]